MSKSYIEKWFDQGLFKEALVGETKGFFIRSRWSGAHDTGTILNNIYAWVDNDSERQKIAEKGFLEAIEYLLNQDRLYEALELFRLYYSRKKARPDHLFSKDHLIKQKLKDVLNAHAKEISTDLKKHPMYDRNTGRIAYSGTLINSVENLLQYVPDLYSE